MCDVWVYRKKSDSYDQTQNERYASLKRRMAFHSLTKYIGGLTRSGTRSERGNHLERKSVKVYTLHKNRRTGRSINLNVFFVIHRSANRLAKETSRGSSFIFEVNRGIRGWRVKYLALRSFCLGVSLVKSIHDMVRICSRHSSRIHSADTHTHTHTQTRQTYTHTRTECQPQ